MSDSRDKSPSPKAPLQPAGRDPASLAAMLGVAVVIAVADLWSKAAAFQSVAGYAITMPTGGERAAIPPHEPMVLIPNVLALRLTTNMGAVFGLGQGGQWFFILISVIAAAVIARAVFRIPARSWWLLAALGLVLGGAVGNLYDRLRYQQVRDLFYLFPDVHLPFGLAWPGGQTLAYPWLFNIADVALVVGVALLVVIMWVADVREHRRAKAAADLNGPRP